MIRKLLKGVTFLLYFSILAAVFMKLFMEPQFDRAVALIFKKSAILNETLKIGYTDAPLGLSPLLNDSGSRSRLLHIFEPLVKLDADLKIVPALAISFGYIDETTWEFRLREGVKFHNGAALTPYDAIFSIKKAINNTNSGVKDLVATIADIQDIGGNVIKITTKAPDPLLLQKMSSVLIFKSNENSEFFGTGPFKMANFDEKDLMLSRFEEYWGEKPQFMNVKLLSLLSKDEKLSALRAGVGSEIDILANLPADIGRNFSFDGFTLKTRPSLESNFLMFGHGGIFLNVDLRRAVKLVLDTAALTRLAQGFAVNNSQFVPDGIFGFNQEIKLSELNLDEAEKIIAQTAGDKKITLDLPRGLEAVGKNISEQLALVGLTVTPNYLDSVELSQKILQKKSDFYFFGWKFDLGDALDFLTGALHSPSADFGQFNGGNYKNSDVDVQIELAQRTLDDSARVILMREAMKAAVQDDVTGIPLFTPEILYGVSSKLRWNPRVDGLVLAQEVKM